MLKFANLECKTRSNTLYNLVDYLCMSTSYKSRYHCQSQLAQQTFPPPWPGEQQASRRAPTYLAGSLAAGRVPRVRCKVCAVFFAVFILLEQIYVLGENSSLSNTKPALLFRFFRLSFTFLGSSVRTWLSRSSQLIVIGFRFCY